MKNTCKYLTYVHLQYQGSKIQFQVGALNIASFFVIFGEILETKYSNF